MGTVHSNQISQEIALRIIFETVMTLKKSFLR